MSINMFQFVGSTPEFYDNYVRDRMAEVDSSGGSFSSQLTESSEAFASEEVDAIISEHRALYEEVRAEADQLESTYNAARQLLRSQNGGAYVPTREEVLAFMSTQADIQVSRLDPDEVNTLLDFFVARDQETIQSGGVLTERQQMEAEFRFEAIILAGVLKRIGKQQVKRDKENKLQKKEDKVEQQRAEAVQLRKQRQLQAERKRPSKKEKQASK